jgi:hypothetical protein
VTLEVLAAIFAAILASELTGVSRWAAAKVTRWAARRIYPSDPARASGRAEEWQALISDSIPMNISALCFGLSLGVMALGRSAARHTAALAPAAAAGLMRLAASGLARWPRVVLLVGAAVTVAGISLPGSAYLVPGLLTMLAGVLIPSGRGTPSDAAQQAGTKLAHRR